ncbi:unnamed protein product [Urochloa decumbens]|uniref:Uncharacterized protein n=1 Tax=Urochloa decumbens TaxID=240449 RepID=A0ABC9CBV5_9POAL
MAPKTAALTILLLVVSLLFADHVKCQQLAGGSQGQELAGNGSGGVDGGGGEVSPNSNCIEQPLYHGPCIDMVCAAACFVQMHRGGHCKGGLKQGTCFCFVCS